jgi:lycopene cyclase domain-containing protein
MIQFAYLAGLLVGITGMAVIDWRYKLAFWRDRKRTILTLAISIGVFVVWDILGIMLGIFFHGGSKFTLPLRLLPEFPLEELFFLLLLCYCTLVIYQGAITRWPRT